jgi:SAM-dependent methyltransferase
VSDQRWLAAAWPVARALLPTPPARVLEIGCGQLGGFVPMLRAAGYEAIGVDPEAPAGPDFVHSELELVEGLEGFHAAVASTSLHHVADPAVAVDRVEAALAPGGRFVVLEWAWEELDEATARWGFARLSAGEDGWLAGQLDRWNESGQPWEAYFTRWAEGHGLHRADTLLRDLDRRFERTHAARGPYLFPELDASEADERAAIEAGEIRATRVDWAGLRT